MQICRNLTDLQSKKNELESMLRLKELAQTAIAVGALQAKDAKNLPDEGIRAAIQSHNAEKMKSRDPQKSRSRLFAKKEIKTRKGKGRSLAHVNRAPLMTKRGNIKSEHDLDALTTKGEHEKAWGIMI